MLICVEAYKELEEDFTAILSSCADSPLHKPARDDLRFAMTGTAISLGFPIGKPNWWSELPFGIFAKGLVCIFDLFESSRRSASLRFGKTLFYEVLDKGLQALVEDLTEFPRCTFDVVRYMKDRNNFEVVVREWACGIDRNDFCHPFASMSSLEDRQSALSFYQETIEEGKFTSNFRYVELLTLIKLKASTAKMERDFHRKNISLRESLLRYYGDSEVEDDETYAESYFCEGVECISLHSYETSVA